MRLPYNPGIHGGISISNPAIAFGNQVFTQAINPAATPMRTCILRIAHRSGLPHCDCAVDVQCGMESAVTAVSYLSYLIKLSWLYNQFNYNHNNKTEQANSVLEIPTPTYNILNGYKVGWAQPPEEFFAELLYYIYTKITYYILTHAVYHISMRQHCCIHMGACWHVSIHGGTYHDMIHHAIQKTYAIQYKKG